MNDTLNGVHAKKGRERLAVGPTDVLLTERVNEHDGCGRPKLFTSDYRRSRAMKKLVADRTGGVLH